MHRDPLQAYDRGTKTSDSIRDLEANALFKAARLLDACRQGWNEPGRDERLMHALRNNLLLWTLFQAELSQSEHPMAPELRVDLLRLSAFVDRRTFELMSAPEAEGLRALIEINRQIGTGLASNPT